MVYGYEFSVHIALHFSQTFFRFFFQIFIKFFLNFLSIFVWNQIFKNICFVNNFFSHKENFTQNFPTCRPRLWSMQTNWNRNWINDVDRNSSRPSMAWQGKARRSIVFFFGCMVSDRVHLVLHFSFLFLPPNILFYAFVVVLRWFCLCGEENGFILSSLFLSSSVLLAHFSWGIFRGRSNEDNKVFDPPCCRVSTIWKLCMFWMLEGGVFVMASFLFESLLSSAATKNFGLTYKWCGVRRIVCET